MVNILRRWSQPLMVVIATLVIVSFAFWGNRSLFDRKGGDVVDEVYGKKITREELERMGNQEKVYMALRCGYHEALATAAEGGWHQQEDERDLSIFNALVFEHEADVMGIGTTEQEVEEELARIPAFQQGGKFDVGMFDMMVQRVLMPNGFSKENIDTFLKGAVRMRKVKDLLKSTATVTPTEIQDDVAARNQLTEASYAALKKADFTAGVVVTDDELTKRYEEQKEQFKTPEQRKVRFVSFVPPAPADPAKPPSPTEQTTALQKCVNAAYDFSQLIKKGSKFDDLIAKQQSEQAEAAKVPDYKAPFTFAVAETEPFSNQSPPAALEESEDIAEAIFALTKESPVSAHLIGKKGAYVALLPEGGITEPKQKTFDECKAIVTGQLQSEKADEAMRKKGEELQKKIVEATKAGKSFAEACEAAGVKAEIVPAFSQKKPAPGPLAATIQQAAAKLAPGEVSEFITSTEGGLVVHLDNRPVIDEKDLVAESGAVANMKERYRTEMIFREWLKERRHAAGLGLKKPTTDKG